MENIKRNNAFGGTNVIKYFRSRCHGVLLLLKYVCLSLTASPVVVSLFHTMKYKQQTHFLCEFWFRWNALFAISSSLTNSNFALFFHSFNSIQFCFSKKLNTNNKYNSSFKQWIRLISLSRIIRHSRTEQSLAFIRTLQRSRKIKFSLIFILLANTNFYSHNNTPFVAILSTNSQRSYVYFKFPKHNLTS